MKKLILAMIMILGVITAQGQDIVIPIESSEIDSSLAEYFETESGTNILLYWGTDGLIEGKNWIISKLDSGGIWVKIDSIKINNTLEPVEYFWSDDGVDLNHPHIYQLTATDVYDQTYTMNTALVGALKEEVPINIIIYRLSSFCEFKVFVYKNFAQKIAVVNYY